MAHAIRHSNRLIQRRYGTTGLGASGKLNDEVIPVGRYDFRTNLDQLNALAQDDLEQLTPAAQPVFDTDHIVFDGSDFLGGLPTQTGDFTYIIKYKLDVSSGSLAILVGTTGSDNFQFYIHDNNIRYKDEVGGATATFVSGQDLRDGQTRTLAIVREGLLITCYLDNVVIGTTASTATPFIADRLGRWVNADFDFEGNMYNVSVFPRALNLTEVGTVTADPSKALSLGATSVYDFSDFTKIVSGLTSVDVEGWIDDAAQDAGWQDRSPVFGQGSSNVIDNLSQPDDEKVPTWETGYNPVGSELITNGTFRNDVTGWIGSNATLASVNGRLEVTNTAGGNPHAYQAFVTEVGKAYVLSYDFTKGTTGGDNQFRIGEASSGFPNHYLKVHSISESDQKAVFVATTTTTYAVMGYGQTALGQTSYWDNISIREAVIADDFTADINWGKGTNWSIGSGVATSSGASGDAGARDFTYIGSNISIGTVYELTLDITSYTSGTLTLYAGGSLIPVGSSLGTKTIYFEAGVNVLVLTSGTGDFFTGSIDNVILRDTVEDNSKGRLTFNGTDYFEDLPTQSGDFTYVMKVNAASPYTTKLLVGTSSGNVGHIYLTDNSINYMSSLSVTRTWFVAPDIHDNIDRTYILTRKGDVLEMWVDGVSLGTKVDAGAFVPDLIGAWFNGDLNFIGSMYFVETYSKAISDHQIGHLSQWGPKAFKPTPRL